MDFLIGRQPIFDQQRKIVAYELLFRGPGSLGDGTQASNQLIFDALLEQGLQRVVGECRAFINFTRENLLEGTALLLPKDRVVIEVLEDVLVDDAMVEAVRRLCVAGYTIALDDFAYDDCWLPLLSLVHIVKLDVLRDTEATLAQYVKKLRPHGVQLLAEKIETERQYEICRILGCQYFQGFFFEHPNMVGGKRVHGAQHAAVTLLMEINKPDLDFDRLCKLIARDVGLSYKLLRYINSAYFNFSGKVESIQRAVMLLGLVSLQRWASLIALSQAATGQDSQLLCMALARAHMCESLAKATSRDDTEPYFLAGLISVLDLLLGIPMTDVLQGLPLTDKLLAALLRQEGDIGAALSCVHAYERWDVDHIHYDQMEAGLICRTFLESVDWAYSVIANLSSCD